MKTKSGKGFTLTELLVVVLVIAILAAVAVPIYKRTVARSHASDAIHVLDTVAAKQEVMWVETGTYANNFATLGAPVKGLNTTGNATIGDFTYGINNACATANKGDYTLYKNYITQETGCTGDGCSVLKGLVSTGTVGCDMVVGNEDDGSSGGTTPANICDIDPSACCPSGSNWNGSACISCMSPKVWSSASKSCQCGNVCSNGATPDPDSCTCSCTGTCSGGKKMNAACQCECPAELPNWNGTNCVAACASPKIRWTGTSCECPISAPIYVSSNNTCISACSAPKEWNGTSCVCPESTVTARINCVATGGNWNDTTCSCNCVSPRTQMSGTSCVCPSPKTRFTGSTCECPVDRPIFHSASGTCIGNCANPTEWNFTTLQCECSAAAAVKKEPCTSSGGLWSETACTCNCTSPRVLNSSSGECYCASPRSYWSGSDCICPLSTPNWNATNSTCNPPCADPQNYWNGTQCVCPSATPKYVSASNQCCLSSQGESCGTGLANTLTGAKPCTGSTCICPAGSALTSGYCCSSTYPNFINTTLGCCKSATAGTACGGGITGSSATGKIDCNTATCMNCGGSYPTLRNGYCCFGSCTNGTFIGEGSSSCNCVCSVGYKYNASTGNCDSCGPELNFTWTDNKCSYTCNPGYCRDGSGKCIAIATGYWRNSSEACTACTNKPSGNSTYTGNGDTLNNCAWTCNTGNCYDGSSCKTIPTGQWRNGESCAACTNKPASNSSYTGNGGTSNTCPWSCSSSTCFNSVDCVETPIGQWKNDQTCTDCQKPGNSMFLGSGTTGVDTCPWTCNSAYCWTGSYCDVSTIENFRNAEGNCVACAGAKCWDGSACNSTTNTLFRKPATGLCQTCSGTNCWNSSSSECTATSNTLFRKSSSGICLGCDALTSCYNAATESCLSQSTTNFRQPASGSCVACSGANCWTGTACTATTSTNFRNSSGICVSCSGSNCWNGSSCVATSATNFRNSSGVCVSCAGTNCWTGSACVATSTTNFRNSSGVCVSCSGSNCWNGSACVATTATNFRATTGNCTACSGTNCWNSSTSTCTAIPTGQWRNSGGVCTACTNKAASNSTYTGNGGTSDSCAWQCNTGTCFNTSDCVTTPTGQYRNGNNCSACTNKPANTTYTDDGGTSDSCPYSGNTGYCYNGTSYLAIPIGYYRVAEDCTPCTNKLPNTYYTSNGGTNNSCDFSGLDGYCKSGSSYIPTATGYYRNGENCAACSNKPANTYYTGAGTTSNNCPYSGNSGYCKSGTSYIAIATGYYRSGENCTACTNKPANTTYTGNGGTTNSCAYTASSGYCKSGTSYIAIPTGYYLSGENCTACTNKPANTSYTGPGTTTSNCAYTGNSGYCFDGSAYVSVSTGSYRDGENCKSCTNKPANSHYTGNGGTTNTCAYSGDSGYCWDNVSYTPTPTGYYRSGESCTSCTNKPANTSYTSNGGTTNSCSYTGNSGYCYNGTSYIAVATGYYRSGENCVACSNKPANTYYTGNGGTTNSCAYKGNSGYCYNGSSYVAIPTGYYRNGENCTSCSNKPANTSYTDDGGTSNSCGYTGNSGYCYNGSSYVTIPTGQYRSGENCTACTNKPSNTSYTSNGGTTNSCSYTGISGYCYNGSSYVVLTTGYWRSGENCAACTNKPANTYYTGAGTTANNCSYTGNSGYCSNGSAYVSIPTGYWRNGESCASCSNKPANSYYTGSGGLSNACGWACNSGYYQSGNSCIANNVNCDSGNVKYQTCLTNGTQSSTCIAGSPNYWNSWSSCTCNSGYCSNGTSCISIATGYYRNGNTCTTCSNKPSNTYYTGNGGTSNSCAYTGSSGYCYNGSSYVSIPTGYYRNGENCAACTNKPANTSYTGNGGTSNSCGYTGNSGYCYNGSSYVAIPSGYFRNGENCSTCSNKPANSSYTGSGGTSNSCSWSCNSGYCYDGSTCVSVPTGYYRNGNNCTACTNKPANTYYTGNGGTSNSCSYTGNGGYCYNGSSYVSTPTGYYRSGENCAACSNKASSNSAYTSNGGTSNSCSWQCNSGYCYNGSDCAAVATGQYRSGNNCASCTNKPANTYYTGNGGYSNNCPYTGSSSYCFNGSSYTSTPTGYYRSGENCVACTNKASSNSTYTGNGGTSNSCGWQCNSGYCYNGSDCVGIPTGQWRNGNNCASCSNAPSYAYYTGNGGTSNSCGWQCNSGYCWNGSACVGIPTGQWRNGNNCASCTNAPSYSSYTGNGGTSNSCSWSCNSGYCYNGSTCTGIPTGQWRNGNNCTSCTNAPSYAYYTSSGGTSNSCGWACNGGYCWNGSSCTGIPTGQWRSGNNCASCTNAPSYAYYTGNGGTSNACGWACNSGYCWNGSSCTGIPTGYYRSGNNCASCSNAPSYAYYTGNGGTSNSCGWACNSGYCWNGSSCTGIPTGQWRSGNNCASCSNAPSYAYYTSSGGTSNSCGWACNSGYCWNGSSCVGIPTGYYRSGNNCAACSNAPSYASYTSNGGTSNSCGWSCNSGYCQSGSSCYASSYACSYSGQTSSDRSGCSNHGTRYRTCYGGSCPNLLYWGGWGSCSCDSGYTGSTCASCASGYCGSGSSCYYTTGTCASGNTQSDTSGCSGNGTRYRSCNTGTCPYSWNSWGSCSCNSGYCGSDCSIVTAGTCATGTNAYDGAGCNNRGTRYRSCYAGCPNYWGGWSSCSCQPGYTGSTCSGCASGYCSPTSGVCVSQTATCSPGQTQTDTSGCGGVGTRTRTCNTSTCPYSWGSWSSCSYSHYAQSTSYGVLAYCHDSSYYKSGSYYYCSRTYKRYFSGGSLPYASATSSCAAHYALYNSGYWWNYGSSYDQGTYIPSCSSTSYDSICNSYCSSSSSSCSYKCIKSESVPSTCSTYTCNGGRFCDNSSGSAQIMTCAVGSSSSLTNGCSTYSVNSCTGTYNYQTCTCSCSSSERLACVRSGGIWDDSYCYCEPSYNCDCGTLALNALQQPIEPCSIDCFDPYL